ncbi:MAG: HEAT repeat domain-containing protein [Phycisphaerales bacterium]|nr:HEAT repeat domain-containing protein [Phycisphaerales bacterium]
MGSEVAKVQGATPAVVREYGSLVKQDQLRDQAVRTLEALTLSADPQVRAHAMEALVPMPRALGRVVDRGLLDNNLGVRSIAAMSIGRARLSGHESTLRRLLADESPFVEASAIYALVQTRQSVDRGPLAQYLFQENDPGLRAHVAFLLGEMGDPSALPLIRDAARAPMPKADSARLRLLDLQLSEAMAKLGDERQLEPLRAALFPAQPSDLEATALAVQAIGEVQDRSARGMLIQLSERAGPQNELMPPEILLSISIAMAKLGDQNGAFLADPFWDDDRALIRADAASVYGWTNRVEDLAKLERMLSDQSEAVQVAAAGALVRRLK